MLKNENSLKKIAQFKAKIELEEGKISKRRRLERNGYLFAFGILVEKICKNEKDSQLYNDLKERVNLYLKDYHLERAVNAFDKINEVTLIKKEKNQAETKKSFIKKDTPIDEL